MFDEISRLSERFMQKVRKPDAEDGCWEWIGGKNGSGYGAFKWNSVLTMAAHRAAYLLFLGEIPRDMYVLHKCDNRACVNPAHLDIGTHADNMREASLRGRIVSGPEHYWSRNPRRGEDQRSAKLTEDDVREMRQLHAEGAGVRQLARKYGLHENTARACLKRRTWRHVV